MRKYFGRGLAPLWMRRFRSLGGVTLLEAGASFLILGIASMGTLKTFALGRVGLESEYEYKMAAELLRQHTEYVIGTVYSQQPSTWPGDFENGNNTGVEVVIDAREGHGSKPVKGLIYHASVEEKDLGDTPNVKPDYYEVHTWIEWVSPRQSAWLDGMSHPPTGQNERIDFKARVVPLWLDK